ncbi:N-6 DNA methylase [Segatella copri]|uniref:Eco57I restriction-modification methylase domain-containing protein n=1 Tax=Segatella copri TaxID=165179 RepID=UPI001C479905|nr:N-6 DNA methylase [Segatella copri]MBW0031290.1 N-6 DNA methylase [Segatella copri]
MATYNKETFKRLFQSKFNLSKWQMLLQDYFHADKVRVNAEVLDEDAEDRKGYFLGSMTTQDNYELGFFYYEMEDGSVLRRKVGLRNLIRPYLGYGFDAALAVFNDGANWRLSLICDLKEDATSTKRFTYVFGDEKAFYKTPILRFESLRTKANEFLEIKKAFSVEALSDDFFDEYRKQYAEFVKFLTGKEYVKKGNKWVEQETGEPDAQYFTSFKKDDKLVRDYIKKMMGRIVFLYFLQSKGWLARNLHYMHDLFYDASDEVKGDFLDKVLEPMFFGLLNTKPEDRSSAPLVNGVGVKYIPNADEIPYLNGGLFQQEKIDEVESVFPAGMFQSLFDFFDSYNFTIDENDPNDAEVGVDPEMLGKIFENLLEDNKDKGAFYTPKEIVRYMCQESLTAYLQTGIDDAEVKEHIANFVKTNDVEELGGASSELAMSIDQKLIDVKICDPAIGSGAFPMGLLRELYACRKSIEIFEEDNAADIKRHIIQNNIYGVDIEKGAVDIARLRFWLALIIDEKEPMPLPNLDFKIMQGNSLLESYKGVDLDVTSKKLKTGKDTKKTRGVLSLGFEETDVQKVIQDLVKSYFSITDHTLRAQRRQQIDKYVKDYIKVCAEGNHEVQDAVDELEIPNDQFFLWHTYFADVFEQGGFDIVIGNPPYNEVRDLDKELQESYKKSLFYAQAKGGRLNLFQFFYPLALYILKSYGICSFITQNSILAEESAIGNRKMIFSDSLVLKVDSFPERDNVRLRVFESVKMSVAILLIRKQTNIVDQTFHVNVWKDKFMSSKSILKISKQEIMQVYPNDLVIPICDNIRWNILSKMRSVGIFSINAQAGEIDMTKYKSNFSQDKIAYRVVTGAQVLRYRLTDTPSQGSVLYLKKVDLSESRYAAFEQERIVMQRITGVDSKIRIIATMLPKCTYCANSTNYISGCSNQIDLLYLLGVLNSKSINFFFKQTSTNTNVTSKEIAKFPILVNVNSIRVITKLVKEILDLKQRMFDTSALENQIDFLVYHLYGLTYDEVLIVDPKTPISREEYEAYKEQ